MKQSKEFILKRSNFGSGIRLLSTKKRGLVGFCYSAFIRRFPAHKLKMGKSKKVKITIEDIK